MRIGNKILFSFLAIVFIYIVSFIPSDYMLTFIENKASGIPPLYEQNIILSQEINTINTLESEIDSYIVIGSEELKLKIINYPEESSRRIYALIGDEKTKADFKTALLELSGNINSLIEINEQPENKFGMNNQIVKVYQSVDKLKELEKKISEEKINELQKIIKQQKDETSQLAGLFLLTGILIFCIGILLAFLLSKSITKPIINLRNAVNAIGQGNLDAKIDVGAEDEVGELAKAFNRMIKDLKESKIKLEEYSKSLEKKVQERTKELAGKNTEYERINKLVVGRELKMVELKKENQELKKKLGLL